VDSKESCKDDRFWNEPEPRDGEREERVEFGKDYDRILYSTALRRLNGVTQVVSSDETILFHNRLTHSLKVAQVGVRIHQLLERQIAKENLGAKVDEHGGMDSRIVRAACMAHDLGHPPFGHIAEKALQRLLAADPDSEENGNSIYPNIGTRAKYHLIDSFEGNAQTFRIVTKLAFRQSDEQDAPGACRALNLTRGTLSALQKYPWPHKDRPQPVDKWSREKWGCYDSEQPIFDWSYRHLSDKGYAPGPIRTIEAQIMDWADDISYAVHDVEDFFRTGAIPLNLLSTSDAEMDQVLDYAWPQIERVTKGSIGQTTLENKLGELRDEPIFPKRPFRGSRKDREQLHLFASRVIDDALQTTRLDEEMQVKPLPLQLAVVEFFKQLTWYYVIDRPALGSAQRGEIMLIRQLFRDLTAWVQEDWLRGEDNAKSHVRAIRREQGLPTRLLDYLDIAFSPDPITGCSTYARDDHKIARAVVDYIVSLTERQAVELGKRLSGHTPSAVEMRWF